MFNVTEDWNSKQAALNEAIKSKEIELVKTITESLHSMIHSKSIYQASEISVLETIKNSLGENDHKMKSKKGNVTIAWNLWHITRIEDLCANIFIADGNQVFNDTWKKHLNISITDTGNAMSAEEIKSFSETVNIKAMFEYRDEVGKQTKKLIKDLQVSDLKRKVSKKQVQKILDAGGVTEQEESIWLLDFWGRKNVEGLLKMPITRHQIVHLNDCIKTLKL